jgi:SAM-dependent methyltransferase
MKLSEIVAYLNQLDTLSTDKTLASVTNDLNSMMHYLNNESVDNANLIGDMQIYQEIATNAIGNFQDSLDQARAKVGAIIKQFEPEYYRESDVLYRGMLNDTPELIFDRRKSYRRDTVDLLHSRIKLYADWHYPGMVIRPKNDSFVDDLVALDPLYIVDTHETLLEPAVQRFPEVYQRRLRQYVIHERAKKKTPIFNQLPAAQFGLIFAHEYFHYKPMHLIERYMTEMFDLLRPGGVLMFSYNNCDVANAVKLVEHHTHMYTPGTEIKAIAHTLGYRVLNEINTDDGLSLLELCKNGERTSLRGGQTVALIESKIKATLPEPQKYPIGSLDNLDEKVYTEQEKVSLKYSAVLLGLYSEESVNQFETLEHLEKLNREVSKKLSNDQINRAQFQEKLQRLLIKRNLL